VTEPEKLIAGLIWEKYFLGSYVSSPFQILKNNRSGQKSCDAWVIFYHGKPIAGRKTLKQAKEYCENYIGDNK